MKKLSLVIIIVILLLSTLLCACDSLKGDDNSSGVVDVEGSNDNTPDTPSNDQTDKPSADDHTHTYGAWKTITAPTCKKEGERECTCSCGSKETDKLPKSGHNYVNGKCTVCNRKDPNVFVPDYKSGKANTVGSDAPSVGYTAQDEYIYFSDGRDIRKLKMNGTVKTVYSVSAGEVYSLNVVGDWLYFYCEGSTAGKSYIAKVRTDGSGFEKLVSSVNVSEMLVVKDKIYYTTFSPYNDWSKEWFSLYRVSVNGGNSVQIHDGAVRKLLADSTYLYFIHTTEDDERTVSRIKHTGTTATVLMKNDYIITMDLENSRLYFSAFDRYGGVEHEYASINTSGGDYVLHFKLIYCSDHLKVVGNKLYCSGEYFNELMDRFEEGGFMEYDLNAKTFRRIGDYLEEDFVNAFNMMICGSFDPETERIDYIDVYFADLRRFKKFKVS